MIYISQGFLIIGYFIFFISRFRKDKKSILITDNVSRVCFIVGYYLFGSINSVEHTIYGIVRNMVGHVLISKKKNCKIFGFMIMLIILIMMYSFSFRGMSTVMFMLSGFINLFVIIFANEQGIRFGTVCVAVCNIIAFCIIGSYASIIGEILCGIMGVLSFLMEHRQKENLI